MTHVQCQGTEDRLIYCDHVDSEQTGDCSQSNDVILSCVINDAITNDGHSPPLQECQSYSSSPLGSNGRAIVGRIGRGFSPTTCDFPVFFPGVIGDLPRYYAVIGPWENSNDEPTCFACQFDRGTCEYNGISSLIHPVAYTSFDENDIGANYLGDISNADDFQIFSFTVPPKAKFDIIGQQIRDIPSQNNGAGCIFSVNCSSETDCS